MRHFRKAKIAPPWMVLYYLISKLTCWDWFRLFSNPLSAFEYIARVEATCKKKSYNFKGSYIFPGYILLLALTYLLPLPNSFLPACFSFNLSHIYKAKKYNSTNQIGLWCTLVVPYSLISFKTRSTEPKKLSSLKPHKIHNSPLIQNLFTPLTIIRKGF